LNVATLNQNNNTVDSVVLPPRMKDIYGWWDLHTWRGAALGQINTAYDRSGRGNNLANDNGSEQPDVSTALSTQFNHGKSVALFNVGDHLENSGADFDGVFGNVSSPTTDPEFEIALVLAEANHATGHDTFFSFNSSTQADQIYLARHNQGIAFRVRGSVDNTFDTSDADFTADTAQTLMFSLQQDGAGEMNAYGWLAGTALDWDDTGISTNYPMDPATFRGMDELTMGGMNLGAGEYLGYIAEVIFWDGKHTAAERTELLNYLRDKWDCT